VSADWNDEEWSLIHEALIRDAGREIPAPQITTKVFCNKALGQDPGTRVPLSELVTPESLARWEEAFNDGTLVQLLSDHAPSTMVRYLSPDWAMIFFAEHEGEPILVTEPTEMMGLGLFLRYDQDSRRWLIHLLGDPATPVEELP
jgi:hypothetical protein